MRRYAAARNCPLVSFAQHQGRRLSPSILTGAKGYRFYPLRKEESLAINPAYFVIIRQ
jgi:hypothetical protein